MIYQKPNNLEEKIKDWKEPEFSDFANEIIKNRYLVKDDSGNETETPKEMLYRVAHVISRADSNYGDFDSNESERIFYDLMADGKFFPNSPTLRGAGLDINLSACYKIPVEDSREGIFIDGLYGAVSVQAYGGGTGFNFSKLRPKNSLVSTTKGKSSGPISFMKAFDYVIGPVIAQGGTRNGANMAILEYNHPDIEEFITCKSNGGINNFNISVGVTEEFMEMVGDNREYSLKHPKWNGNKKVNAREIFNKIVHNAWINGDPGLIFLDRLEKDNPTPALGKIDGTNPCGEQPLLDHEACNLGSINLTKFVIESEGKFSVDYAGLGKTVYHAIRFLDNVIDVNKYPLERPEKDRNELREILKKQLDKEDSKIEQIIREFSQSPIEKIVKGNRKIGLGVMGFADMLFSLGVPYGSEDSLKIAEDVMGFISKKSKEASVELAKTRGVFPNWKNSVYDPESEYFKGEEIKPRNATTTTIAPTGTLSILVGCEGGIEAKFSLSYTKKAVYDESGKGTIESIIVDNNFERIAKEEGFYTKEFFLEMAKKGGSIGSISKPKNLHEERWNYLKKIFVTSNELEVEKHAITQAAFQKHTDNAVSKTINMSKNAPKEWVMNAYLLAYELGLKGITIYRDGSKENQVRSTGKTSGLEKNIRDIERPEVIGTTIPQLTPQGKAYVTLNVRRDDTSKPYEAFIVIGKGGQDMSAIGEGIGRLASLCFQLGAKPETVIGQLDGIGGEMQIPGKERIKSLPDALAKGIKEAYNILNNGRKIETEKKAPILNICSECGGITKFDGGCRVCTNCGDSKCG